jgi:hypothetical protein
MAVYMRDEKEGHSQTAQHAPGETNPDRTCIALVTNECLANLGFDSV